MQFNIHTHNKASRNSFFNLRLGIDADIDDYPYFFSAGIHPWDINTIDIPKTLLKLTNYLRKENCISLGEIGLDKICGTDLEYQKEVFQKQLEIAHKSNTKVLIIHCVKSYQEIIEEKLRCPYHFIWILHSFNGSPQLIKQLTKHGFYFSIGPTVLNHTTKIANAAAAIPSDRLFLETDESVIGIDKIYKKIAEILHKDLKQIETQVAHNLQYVFGLNFSKT